MHVLSHLPHASAVLLDQTDQEAAAGLSVVGVVVLFIQPDHKLGVGPERVCGMETVSQEVRRSADRAPRSGGLTGKVPAAAGGGPPPPTAVELGESPLGQGLVRQGVGRQVADLQPGVVAQEVRERHPGRRSRGCDVSERWRRSIGG